MRLQEIMSTPVITTVAGEPVRDARDRMRAERIHHLVVVDDQRKIIGVLSERDARGAAGLTVGDVMTRGVVTANPQTTVRQAANLLRGRGIGCLPVVTGRKLKGLVTVSDLLELLGRGAERPIAESVRWTMRGRGPRRQKAARA
jgi:acetoin utilization protein AcuB